jgi:hypothetical protein
MGEAGYCIIVRRAWGSSWGRGKGKIEAVIGTFASEKAADDYNAQLYAKGEVWPMQPPVAPERIDEMVAPPRVETLPEDFPGRGLR